MKASDFIVIGVVIAAIVLFSGSIKRAFNFFSVSEEEKKKEIEKEEKEISSLKVQESKLDPKKNYKTIADILYNCMEGMGTKNNLFFETIEGLNDEELKQVYKEFGVREEYLFMTWTIARGNLRDWILSDFSGSKLERIKDIFKGTGLL